MSDGEQALIVVTTIVALANMVAAIAALRAATAARRVADVTRWEFALARRPAVVVKCESVSFEGGDDGNRDLVVLLYLIETGGHHAYVHEASAGFLVTGAVVIPLGDDPLEPRVLHSGITIRNVRVYEGISIPLLATAELESLKPYPATFVRARYTFSSDHIRWHRETWEATMAIYLGDDGPRQVDSWSHRFCGNEYVEEEDGLRQKAGKQLAKIGKWLEKNRREMGG